MSGICGYFRYDGKQVEGDVLADMLHILRAQGPDEQAYWQAPNIALGHTQLKTTREAATEQQPSSLDGQIWVTADARIDGRLDLIAKLRGKGVDVEQTVSDDHLILHAYMVWGADCLKHLIGDFAFILWDDRRQDMFCATDQMGVSPLYYAQIDGGILASNNVNAIRAHPAVSSILNEQAIGDYLLFRMNHAAKRTTFRDIHKLAPGECLTANRGKLLVGQYWAMSEAEPRRRNPAEIREEFDFLFTQAVSDRCRDDYAGTHLSGGMDSTSIAAILAELRGRKSSLAVNAYTYVPALDRLSLERPFAEKVADKLNIPSRVFKDDSEFPLPDITGREDLPPEPSFTSRSTTRFRIFGDSVNKGRNFFAGYGGDPLLHPPLDYWGNLRKSGQYGLMLSELAQYTKVYGKPPLRALAQSFQNGRDVRRGPVTRKVPNWLAQPFVSRAALQERFQNLTGIASLNDSPRKDMAIHPLWRRIFEWHSPAYSMLPMKLCFPFFDVRLVEMMQSVRVYPWMANKLLLRQIMHNRLPQEVLQRPKTAFPANQMAALFEESGVPDWQKILPLGDHVEEFIDVSALRESLADGKNLTTQDTRAVNRIGSLAIWLNLYNKQINLGVMQRCEKLTNFKKRVWTGFESSRV
ncbi:asparagine synthase-related protein [Erythrobacter sp. F6033]|uniref:asparagine synthetase B family protein n=1 Tax=Erythrobacter sp. F6033 TaxID=2926401 RepID=UPI001FF17D6A|nr:asparagine synthase-related protein [Erythrobacter sp. F6033]MCK0127578.1 asparagine synthase-related protein [Erythrobacter sp. F6033]